MDVVYLLCIVRALSAIVRMSLGPILPFLAADLEIGMAEKGQLLSAFSAGYLVTQVVGGSFADKFGAKTVVLFALVATALGLFLASSTAMSYGVSGLCFIYFAVGMVNGPLFPACSVMLRDVPSTARSRSMAIVDAGGTIGACVATAACPALASYVGWHALYTLLAVLASATSVLWLWRSEDPKTKQKSEASSSVACTLSLFTHSAPWALFFAHAVFNFSNYFLNAWLPTMFVERFADVSAATTGAYLMWPEIFGVVSRLVAAAIVDGYILKKGLLSLLMVRRVSSVAAFLLQGLALVLAVQQATPSSCMVLLIFAALSAGVHSCGFKANYLDLTTEHSGLLAGVGNTFASISSTIGPLLASIALSAAPGSWDTLFNYLFVLNCAGALVVACFLNVDNLDSAVKAQAKFRVE